MEEFGYDFLKALIAAVPMTTETTMDSDDNAFTLLLEEFKALKAEQLRRITSRDHNVYLNVLAVAGAMSLLEKIPHPGLLLVVAWICILLGWHHLMNDLKVSRIGDYLREDLSNELLTYCPSLESPLNWEYFQTQDRMRTPRKVTQTIVDLLVFILPGFVSIGIYWTLTRSQMHLFAKAPLTGPQSILACDCFAVTLVISLMLYSVQIFYYSRYASRKSPERSKIDR